MLDNSYMTWGKILSRSASKHPDNVAVKDERSFCTYKQFNERVNRLAHALDGLGLVKGDCIATLSDSTVELVEIFFAALKIGLVVCPLEARAVTEQETQFELVEPKAFAFHPDKADYADRLLKKCDREITTLIMGKSSSKQFKNTEDLITSGSSREPSFKVTNDDIAFVLFTGGTTGSPKGAMLTHENLAWNAINVIGENGQPTPESKVCYTMQLYHSAAISRLLAVIYAGGTFITIPAFEPGQYLDIVEAERCTFLVGNTALWMMLLDEMRRKPRDTSSITMWLHGQGILEVDFCSEVQSILFPNASLYVSYALTEASPGVTVLKPGDQPRNWPGIGRPYMSDEVRLVDEDDNDVPLGESGQILVRGPNVMKGYFRNPEETSAALAGGWLHTGDIGSADDLGYLYFRDRLKDMIKSGGINIYTGEIENVIWSHPKVKEAAVIGVPHVKWGEAVCAIVVLHSKDSLSAEKMIEYCKSKLDSHKKPTSVIFVDSLPRGVDGGKIQKKILREKYGK